jgi:hypothetical protein
MKQVSQGNGSGNLWQLGHVSTYRVIQAELPRLLEPEDGRGGELLGNGPRVETGLRGVGRVELQVRQAEASHPQPFAVSEHARDQAGSIRLVPGLEDRVQVRGGSDGCP